MLIAMDPARRMQIAAISANVPLHPGKPRHDHTVHDLLGAQYSATLHENLGLGDLAAGAPWETTIERLGTSDGGGDAAHDVSAHAHAGLVLVELERSHPDDPGHAMLAGRHLRHALGTMRAWEGGLERLSQMVASGIRNVTGYERVLIYRFDAAWNGQAIAENHVPDWDNSLLGLHFPASDIPPPARALYRLAPLRSTHDRDAEQVPLLLAPGWSGNIDLSHARLRSLSPTHMEYHRRLGVDGAMSISIMVGGELWGLVICHHRRPHRTSAGQRAAAMVITEAFSQRVVPAERAANEARLRREQRLLSSLMSEMARADDLIPALTGGEVTALNMFRATGAALVQGATLTPMGAVPDRAGLWRIVEWLRRDAPAGPVFATDYLVGAAPDIAPDPAVASGLLATFLTEDRADLLLWLRPGQPGQRRWGGDPTKQNGVPRASFEPWTELLQDVAHPWDSYEIEMATLLRHAITEVIVRNLRRIAALNDQLRQSQKMEAVGQLSGGLAHDFNNLLGGITGSLELARRRLAQGRIEQLDRYLTAADEAAGRAAALVNRLLAFSRRQTLDPRPTDVNRLIRSIYDLVRHTVGSTIQLEVTAATGLWTVLCDANQLENALVNLVLNARDAMPEGGRLTLRTANARLDDDFAARFAVPAGDYVALSVTDTGHGMDRETATRAFEPFYTTKPLGKGTGLGLSMVYGFTKQSGGQARIFSQPGEGTTVRLYLPRHLGPAETDPPSPPAGRDGGNAGTVLVVDDEPILRMLVCEVLREHDLTVLEAPDGPSALAIMRSGKQLDLLVTDVGLPGGLNGRQLVDAVRSDQPQLKVLFITGYADNMALSGGLLDTATQVLTKPFTMEALLGKVLPMIV